MVPAESWAAGTLLAELDLLEPNAPGAARSSLERIGTPRVYARGETMLMAGARDTFVLLLLDGHAKVTTVDGSGTDVLVDIRAAGDVVGEIAAFDDRPRSATVVAAQQMYARRISQDQWLRWVTGSRVAELAVSRSLAHRSRVAVRRRTEFVRGPVIARLARAVLDLTEQYGLPLPEGLLVRPGLTQAEWGGLIGARERRVHQALHELARAEALAFGRCRIVVRSVPALRRFAALAAEEW
ncbi:MULTISPECIES: Crp/Fnr family transcriptional regulator [unclassified Streptomyces]|uniref:Crp/Fnr family transcriptional regulator n=1 Tax=unclassified Streptomyces TaxID=2593676 RepID=UPI003825C61A